MQLDFHSILSALADPVVAADAGNRIVFVNRATEQLLGWKAGELEGQPLTTLMLERFHALHVAGFNRYLATREPKIIGHAVRVSARHRDGSEIDIELTLAATGCEDSPFFIASLRDLRDRVELERQLAVTRYLRATNAAAAALGSRLDLEHVLSVVVETLVADLDAALARVWTYDEAANTLHLRASAGLTTRVAESTRACIDVASYPYKVGQVARTRSPFVRNTLQGDPEFDQEWVEREGLQSVAAFPLLFGDELLGVMIYFAHHLLPDELLEALTTFVLLVGSSIHDVKLLRSEQAARQEAEEAVRIRDHFLSAVSHDLKNPLTAVRGQAQLVQHRLSRIEIPDGERIMKGLQSIVSTASKMNSLLNDLTDQAQLQIGRPLDLHPVRADLLARIRAVIAEHEYLAAAHTLTLETSLDALVGEWDVARLDRVFANLLLNATKYSPDGGEVVLRIDLLTGENGQLAELSVRDHGIGIAPEDLPHIFDQFYRGANVAGKFSGTGVGLASAQQIVERHGGTIVVQSQEGKGSTFTVRLPLVPPDRSETAKG